MLHNVTQGLGLGEILCNKYSVRMKNEVLRFGTVQRQALVNTSM
jgi:hypothetical protein